jgi:hypothetical protein
MCGIGGKEVVVKRDGLVAIKLALRTYLQSVKSPFKGL